MQDLRYQKTWERYRFWSRLFWMLFLGFMPGVGLVVWFASDASRTFSWFVPSWFLAAGLTRLIADNIHCPRCDKGFFPYRWGGNGFGRKCVHCDLPKWSGSTFEKPASRR